MSNGEWKLPAYYATAKATGNTSFVGTYILNSAQYYSVLTDATTLSKGRFGMPGRSGSFWTPDKTFYGGIDHVTSLIQCHTDGFGKAAVGAHEKRGVNTTYIDGHVRWVIFPYRLVAGWLAESSMRDYGNQDDRPGRGPWSYATFADK